MSALLLVVVLVTHPVVACRAIYRAARQTWAERGVTW